MKGFKMKTTMKKETWRNISSPFIPFTTDIRDPSVVSGCQH